MQKKVKGRDKEQAVPNDVPGHRGAGAVPNGWSETAAIDIETAGQVEDKGSKEDHEEKVAQKYGTGQPHDEEERQAQEEFEPGEHNGREMGQDIRKNPIIDDHIGKGGRMENLVETRVKKDNPEDQPGRDKKRSQAISSSRILDHASGNGALLSGIITVFFRFFVLFLFHLLVHAPIS